jgi:hypothetical protein
MQQLQPQKQLQQLRQQEAAQRAAAATVKAAASKKETAGAAGDDAEATTSLSAPVPLAKRKRQHQATHNLWPTFRNSMATAMGSDMSSQHPRRCQCPCCRSNHQEEIPLQM